MHEPTVEITDHLTLTEAIDRFAPEQGGIEYQTDQPRKVHEWHSHSVTETLIVLDGEMVLEWAEHSPANVTGCRAVGPGAVIVLPADTIHQSTNGAGVTRYLILPEGGKPAATRVFNP